MTTEHKKKSKIVYVSNTRFPTEKAHGIALAKLCEAFADEGAEVEVIVPKVRNPIKTDPFSFYGTKKNFSIVYLPSVDLHFSGFFRSIFFVVQIFSFSIAAFFHCRQYEKERAVFFSHDYIPLFFLSFLKNSVIYDIHHFPGENFMYKRVMKEGTLFPVQTRWKVEELSKRFSIPKEKIVYWPNGVDIEKFTIATSKEEARKELDLPQDVPLALYIGQLFQWKGADTFIDSIVHVKSPVEYLIVGGEDHDRESLKAHVPRQFEGRVHFFPFQSRDRVPLWMRAADVLVLPNTGKMKVSSYYTSPMKLFEYMAAEKPIIASDIASIREIVSDKEVFFAKPDDHVSFAEAIDRSLSEKTESQQRAQEARKKVEGYTWRKRASSILRAIS